MQFDVCKYNLREQISSLLVGADAKASLFQNPSARRCAAAQKKVGHFPNEQKALEDFEARAGTSSMSWCNLPKLHINTQAFPQIECMCICTHI